MSETTKARTLLTLTQRDLRLAGVYLALALLTSIAQASRVCATNLSSSQVTSKRIDTVLAGMGWPVMVPFMAFEITVERVNPGLKSQCRPDLGMSQATIDYILR